MYCRCDRCGEEITSVYVFDGKHYGWSCIKTVNPNAKKTDKAIIFKADSYSITPGRNATQMNVTAVLDGKKYKDIIFLNYPELGTISVKDNEAFIKMIGK